MHVVLHYNIITRCRIKGVFTQHKIPSKLYLKHHFRRKSWCVSTFPNNLSDNTLLYSFKIVCEVVPYNQLYGIRAKTGSELGLE